VGPLEEDFDAGKEIARLTGDGSSVPFLTFDDGGNRLMGVSTKGRWFEWGLSPRYSLVRTNAISKEERQAETDFLGMGGRGRLVVVGDYLGPLLVFDTKATSIKELDRQACNGDSLAVSEDGELLACGECTRCATFNRFSSCSPPARSRS
jgi:hypothetical protein